MPQSEIDTDCLNLRPYQSAVFRDHFSGIVVLHWGRQLGKSYTLAAWAVYRIMKHPGRLVTVLSNSRENGAEFLLKCSEICRIVGLHLAKTIVSPPNKRDFEDYRMELRLPNEGQISRIKVLAASPRTARGFSGDLILDEFAFHEDSKAIWSAAEPILSSNPDYLCRIASTANGNHNMFYRMVSTAQPHESMQQFANLVVRDEPPPSALGTANQSNAEEITTRLQTPDGAATVHPLPKGEGRGEGEGNVHQPNAPDSPTAQPKTPDPELTIFERFGRNYLTDQDISITPRKKAPPKPESLPPQPPKKLVIPRSKIRSANSPIKLSRLTRTDAWRMGLQIYDPGTRQPITPAQARAQALDKRAYDQNYECSFADENLTLLSHELICAAERDDIGYICEQSWTADALELLRAANNPLYIGFDVARKGDLSVITVMELYCGAFLVRAILRLRDLSLPEQERRLRDVCRLPQFRAAAIDITGMGFGLVEYAQETFGQKRIQGINFACTVPANRNLTSEGRPDEKVRITEAMAMEMLRVYEDRRIQHPREDRLHEDLRKPERITTPGGRVSIAATRDEAGHADHFWSFALAIEAARQPVGNYASESIDIRPKGFICF